MRGSRRKEGTRKYRGRSQNNTGRVKGSDDHIPQYIKFNTRLDSMLFGTRIDESNNLMDPEQIGEAFKEALRPVGLPAKNLLVVYRKFNIHVFHKLEDVLGEANDYLASRGILEGLDVAARDKKMLLNKRSKQRDRCDPKKEAAVGAADASSQLHNVDEQAQRLSEIEEYALRKIDERVLDKELHPVARKFLNEYFLKFLVRSLCSSTARVSR